MRDYSMIDYLRVRAAHLRQSTPFRVAAGSLVIVFPEHKVAYVPVPKAANSSVRAGLLPLISKESSRIEDIQAFHGFEKIKYSSFGKMRGQDWFVFTVVRDPYSRYASAYLDKLVAREKVLRPLRRMGLRKGDSFLRFMTRIAEWPQSALNGHFAQQAILLDSAINDGVHVYRMEELATRWPEIAARVREVSGVEIGSLEHRNKGNSDFDWRSLYDDETKALVRSVAQLDFRLFGYPIDLK